MIIIYSHETHIPHVAPALVVAIGRVWILDVVGRTVVEFGVIWMVRVEFEVSAESAHMLSMHLERQVPNGAFPMNDLLRILHSEIVLVFPAHSTQSEPLTLTRSTDALRSSTSKPPHK